MGEELGNEGVGAWLTKAYGSKGPFLADSSTEGKGFASLGGCSRLECGVCGDCLRLPCFMWDRFLDFCPGTTTLGDLGRWRLHPLGPVGGARVRFDWDGVARTLEARGSGLTHC